MARLDRAIHGVPVPPRLGQGHALAAACPNQALRVRDGVDGRIKSGHDVLLQLPVTPHVQPPLSAGLIV